MLLYSSEDVYAVFHPGNSDYLLITFGYIGLKADDENFWARGLCMKAGINAIGINSRRTDWFPPSRMEACIQAVLPKIREFPRRLIYGASMGGYPIMRYARALETEHAVAYVPQYSIDPRIVGNAKFTEFFEASLHTGMEPTSDNVPTKGFVLYDSGHEIDNRHIEKYRAIAPSVEFVDVPSSGHAVGRLFASTSAALDLFQLALDHDKQGLRQKVRQQRRLSSLRPSQLSERLFTSRPLWSALIFAKYGDTFVPHDRVAMLKRMEDLNSRTKAEIDQHLTGVSATQATGAALDDQQVVKLRRLLAATEEALKISGDDSIALVRDAKEAGKQGNIEEAIAICRRAVAASPKFAETHYVLASLLMQAKEYDEAAESAHRAADLDPDDPDLAKRLAIAHGLRGDYSAATQAAQRAIACAPRDEKLHALLQDFIARGRAQADASANGA